VRGGRPPRTARGRARRGAAQWRRLDKMARRELSRTRKGRRENQAPVKVSGTQRARKRKTAS
jgi:hypothetical protein